MANYIVLDSQSATYTPDQTVLDSDLIEYFVSVLVLDSDGNNNSVLLVPVRNATKPRKGTIKDTTTKARII